MMSSAIIELRAAAARAKREGDVRRAVEHLQAALARAPSDPVTLNSLGMIGLEEGQLTEARRYFKLAITADPSSPELWMNLAKAHRLSGDHVGEADSLDHALAIDQRHFMANVRRAELHEKRGETAGAMHRWSGVIALAGSMDQTNASLDQLLAHARGYIAEVSQGFERRFSAKLNTFRDANAESLALRRFEVCVDAILGRRRIYVNECHGLHYPFLPADEFFDRGHFPWLGELEGKTEVIRSELLALLATDNARMEPYVSQPPGAAPNIWSPLNNSPNWSALFLWKHGVRQAEACAQFPQTTALLDALPLSDIPRRSPSVFFSILRPGAHIPPHTGVTNVRSIVHLPLVVPPDCGFRVGGQTRQWRVGEAFVFDDTIEHEAWNRSDTLRAILIFDIWNPHLGDSEQEMLRALFQEMVDYGLDDGGNVHD
jgi:aspartyl/asparaginyl beta-hydroxylase (cupin superfamily)